MIIFSSILSLSGSTYYASTWYQTPDYAKSYVEPKGTHENYLMDLERNLYNERPTNRPVVHNGIKFLEAQKSTPERIALDQSSQLYQQRAVTTIPAQELFLQESAPASINQFQQVSQLQPIHQFQKSFDFQTASGPQTGFQEPNSITLADAIAFDESLTSSYVKASADKENKSMSQKASEQFSNMKNKASEFKDKASEQLSRATDTASDVVDKASEEASILAEEITVKFKGYLNNQLFTMIKNSLHLSSNSRLIQLSFAEVLAECLQQFAFQLFNISEHMGHNENSSINNFKKQVQYLAEQIQSYNNITIYSNPEKMLLLIDFMNQFLKENNAVNFSQEMYTKLTQVSSLAHITCDLFKNQNMILSSSNTPESILSFFKTAIDNANNLPKLQFTSDLMHAIYDTNEYMDNIMQTWNSFKLTDFNKNLLNRQYAAFLTFLLIFENSIVATTIILNETSALYQVTNPVPVVINIA